MFEHFFRQNEAIEGLGLQKNLYVKGSPTKVRILLTGLREQIRCDKRKHLSLSKRDWMDKTILSQVINQQNTSERACKTMKIVYKSKTIPV